MSSSSRLADSESPLLNSIKRIYNEYEYREISTEKIQLLSEKFYHLWMRPQLLSSSTNKNNEGYLVVEYIEKMLSNERINDHFFILIVSTLAKYQNFYQSFLSDHQRFKKLFNSSIRKPVYLMKLV